MTANVEKKVEVKDEIKKVKLGKDELNEEQKFILSEEIAGNQCSDIYKKTKEVYKNLIDTPVSEDGGRNAVFGFYYQFLVAIDYLIELIEGKWDFMAFEIHDDIIVSKECDEKNVIRYIQVKTSKNPSILCSSTELYNRTEKQIEFENKKLKARINDSWLDKLFINARLFKGIDKIEQQFQLVTNFTFYVPAPAVGAETKNINHYRNNSIFSYPDIKEDDPFYKKLETPVYTALGEKYIYEEETGMSVHELLSKTQILERVDFLESFKEGISNRLGNMLSKKFEISGGATIIEDDINWLIGEMCARCSERDDKLVLFIDKEKAGIIENKLLERAIKYSEEFNGAVGNRKLIDDSFEKTVQEISVNHPEAISELEEAIIFAKQQLHQWIAGGGSVLQLIAKFHEGREETVDFHVKMHKTQRADSLYGLVGIFFLLKIINKNNLISEKYKNILTKEIIGNFGETYDLGLLKIDNYYYEDVQQKLEKIVDRLHSKSHEDLLLMTMNTPHRIVIHGVHDSTDLISFNKSTRETISLIKIDIPELNQEAVSMNEINYKFLLIPWHTIESKYTRFKRNKEEFTTFKTALNELWNNLSNVEEE